VEVLDSSYLGKSGSFDLMKRLNMEKVYKLILMNQPTSRIEIAKASHLTQATVSHCVKYLIECGVVKEIGIMEKGMGRPPLKLVLNNDFGVFIGVEINFIGCRVLVTDINGNEIYKEVFYGLYKNPIDFTNKIAEIALSYERTGDSRKHVVGVGIATVGNYNHKTGVVEYISTMQNWNGYPLLMELERALEGIPCFVLHSSRAGLMGELHFGASSPMEDMAYICGGWGISLSVYVDGKIMYGNQGFAGRFGHTTIVANGKKCTCGNRGCLEAYSSLGALFPELYHDAAFKQEYFEDLIVRKKAGDAEVCQKIESILDYLVIGIVNVINIFNPSQICMGGLLGILFDGYMDEIYERIKKKALPHFLNPFKIYTANLGEYGAAYGGISYTRDQLIQILEMQTE